MNHVYDCLLKQIEDLDCKVKRRRLNTGATMNAASASLINARLEGLYRPLEEFDTEELGAIQVQERELLAKRARLTDERDMNETQQEIIRLDRELYKLKSLLNDLHYNPVPVSRSIFNEYIVPLIAIFDKIHDWKNMETARFKSKAIKKEASDTLGELADALSIKLKPAPVVKINCIRYVDGVQVCWWCGHDITKCFAVRTHDDAYAHTPCMWMFCHTEHGR